MSYTYNRKFYARLGQWPDGVVGPIVVVPDQVADDQHGYWGRDITFPARTDDGTEVMVKIDGEATGLDSEIGGAGDLVVSAT